MPGQERPHNVYTPQSELSHPARLLKSVVEGAWKSRHLAWSLSVRDISVRYRQTIFGVAWMLLVPCVTTLTFVLLREKVGVISTADAEIPYGAFVYFGTLLWQIFVESVHAPIKKFASCKTIFTKIKFPQEAILISSLIDSSLVMAINFFLAIALFLLLGLPLTWWVLAAIPIGVILMTLGIVVGTLLSPLGSLYTDVTVMVSYALNIFFFITPVIYPVSKGSTLWQWNPVGVLINSARDLSTLGIYPDVSALAAICFGILLVGGFSLILYRVAHPILVERMGG